MSRSTISGFSNYTLSTGYVWQDNPTQFDLSSYTWQYLSLELAVTVGSTSLPAGKQIGVGYAFSDSILTPSVAAASLIPYGRMTGVIAWPASSVTYIVSDAIPITANYMYAWLEILDPLLYAATASLSVSQVLGGGTGSSSNVNALSPVVVGSSNSSSPSNSGAFGVSVTNSNANSVEIGINGVKIQINNNGTVNIVGTTLSFNGVPIVTTP
jgi:hypothetical protein